MPPPTDAVILGVSGLGGPQDEQAVEAAIARCDPGSTVWPDWPEGRIAIRSRASVPALIGAVEALGFSAVRQVAPPGPGGEGRVAGRVIVYGTLGCLLGLGLEAAAHAMLGPDCSGPGGCTRALGHYGFLLGAAGIPIGMIAGLIHGLALRRRRAPPS